MNRKRLIRKVFGTGTGLALAAGVGFFVNVYLSRTLSANTYGSVVVILTWALIASQFAQLGFLRGSTKIVSIARAEGDLATLKAFVFFALGAVTIATIFGGFLFTGIIRAVSNSGTAFYTLSAMAGLLLWPLAVSRVTAGIMLGESRNFHGAFFQTGLPYAGIILALGVLALIEPEASLELTAGAIVVGAYIAAFSSVAMVGRASSDAMRILRGPFKPKVWFSLTMPLMLLGAVQVINRQLGTVIVGALASPESAAAYYPALRISEFATFGLIAVNAAVAPRLAAAYSQRNILRVQSTLASAATLTLLSTILLVVGIFLFESFLVDLFGNVASQGKTALHILLYGQIFNAATGSVSVLMAMAGQEKFASVIALVVLIANVVLSLILVPLYGIEGAAVATMLSGVLWNLSLVWRSVRVLKVNPTVFSRNAFASLRNRL